MLRAAGPCRYHMPCNVDQTLLQQPARVLINLNPIANTTSYAS